MRKIKIVKPFDKYVKGDVIEVTKNIAHGLIDKGKAVLYKESKTKVYSSPSDKMLSPKKGKKYKVK